MSCNVRANSKKHLIKKGLISEGSVILSPLFNSENEKLSQIARDKYGVKASGNLYNAVYQGTTGDIKAVENDVMFNELQSRYDAQATESLQLPNTVPSRASNITTAELEQWLKEIGANVKEFKPFGNGVEYSGRAKIDATGALVEYTGDKNKVLPEEAIHIAVEILEQTNPTLFNQMLNKIDKYRVMVDVMITYGRHARYQKDGKPDIRKLKKEAIAKLLVEQFILKREGIVEKPDNLLYSQSWWQKVVEFFKSLFGKASYNPFQVAADAVTTLTADDLQATMLIAKGEFLQLSDAQRDVQNQVAAKLDQKLKDFQVRKVTGKAEFEDQDDINYYERIRNGKLGKVLKRVTDFVKELKGLDILAKFENASPVKKNEWKQKAEWGTRFHADAENIINAALDSSGRLKPVKEVSLAGIVSNLGDNAFYNLAMYLIGTQENPGIMYSQFPAGTLFRIEQLVYDEKRDVAGTIDLLGITPEGKVMIYDWKTKFLNLQKNNDVPWYNQKDYKIQLNQYGIILKQYGIKKEDIVVAQAMPIIFDGVVNQSTGDVSNVRMTLPMVDVKTEKRRYLLPVPVDSQSTGNTLLDDYVVALQNLYKVLYKRKTLNKEVKNEQLNAISGAMRELQIKQEFGPLAEQGEIFTKGAEATLDEINTLIRNPDGTLKEYNSVDRDLVKDIIERLRVQNDNIHKYTSMFRVFRDIHKGATLTPEQQETLTKLERLSLDSQVVEDKLVKQKNALTAWMAEGEADVANLLIAEKPVRGVVDRTIQEISKIQTKGINVLRALTSRAKNNAKIKFDENIRKFEVILKKFNEFASASGLPAREFISLISDKNEKGEFINKLARKYEKEFYTKFDEAREGTEADTVWLSDNIDLDAWWKHAETKFNEIAADIDKTIYAHESLEELEKIRDKKKKEAFDKFDISSPMSLGWFHPSMKQFPKDKWLSADYVRIQNTPALRDMYNFIYDLNNHAKEVGYHDANFRFGMNFLPWLKSSTLDKMKSSGMSAISDMFQDMMKLTPEEEISYAKVDPNTGEIEKKIPAFFINPDFAKREDGTYDLTQASTDLGKTISMYMAAVYEYEALEDIEIFAKAVLDVEKSKKAILVDDKGKIVQKTGTVDPELTENTENAVLYESLADAILYKRQDAGKSGLSPEATRIVDKANNLFRLKVFALNIFTPMTMLMGGNFQGLINGNKLWRGREWIANETKVVTSAFQGREGNLEKGLIDYFLPYTDNTTWEKSRRLTHDQLQKWSFAEIIMSPIRKADRVIQMTTALTMLKNSVLIDGKIYNARKYILSSPEYSKRYKLPAAEIRKLESEFEDKVKELLDKEGLIKKVKFDDKGYLEIEGVDRMSDTVYKTRLAILNEIKGITGALSEEDKREGDRSVLFRSMMMFKSWIVPMASVRFKDVQYNVDINEYEMGRVRMMFQIIKNGDGGGIKGVVKGMQNLLDMHSGNEAGIKALRDYFVYVSEEYKKNTGKDLEISEAEFFDMVRRYIGQQAKEIVVLLTLFGGMLGLMAAKPDDDEDKETKNRYKIAARMVDKLRDEISFYYNPLSLQQLSNGSYLPSLGFLTEGITLINSIFKETYGTIIGDEKLTEKTYPTKNFLRMIPIANQFTQTFLPMMNAELATELGVKVSTESRR